VYAGASTIPLLAGAAICAWQCRVLRAAEDPRTLVFLGVLLALALPEASYVCMLGVESGLLVCLLVLIIWAYLFERSTWLAVLLPLAFLTRIEAPLWLAPIVLHETARLRTLRRRAILALPLLTTMAGLGAFDAFTTGNALPISASLTSTFPVPSPRWYLISNEFARGGLRALTHADLSSLFAAAVVAILLWLPARRAKRAEGGAWIGTLIASGVLSLLLLLFFRKWSKPPSGWHYTQAVIFESAALCPLVLLALGRSARHLAGIVALVLATTGVALSSRGLARCLTVNVDWLRADIHALREATPVPGRLASTDCGYLAFWLDRDIVNLDGLTNDREYQKALRDRDLDGYLTRAGVSYVVAAATSSPIRGVDPMYAVINANADAVRATGDYSFSYFAYSYEYEVFSNTVTFHRADEALRLRRGESGEAFTFRWPPALVAAP
jgi:hypothetical protein